MQQSARNRSAYSGAFSMNRLASLSSISANIIFTIRRLASPSLLSAVTGCIFSVGFLLPTQAASAQTTKELQQQIQQMKQLYQQQISTLESRIASLEQANRAVAHATQE